MKKICMTAVSALILGAALLCPGAAAASPGGAVADMPTPRVEQAEYDLLPLDGVERNVPAAEDGEETDSAADGAGAMAGDPLFAADVPATDADGRFLSPQGLYDHWQREGWPEGVGDLWSADGTMDRVIVAVMDGDEAVIEDIKAQVADEGAFTFVPCTYSHTQLEQVQKEIELEMKAGAACILSVGRGVRDNDFSETGQPCVHVMISTLKPDAQTWADTLKARYGDMVELEIGDLEISTSMGDTMTIGIGSGVDIGGELLHGKEEGWAGAMNYAPYLVLALLAAAGAALLLARRSPLAAQTAGGKSVTLSRRPSRARTEAMVRESTVRPGEENWQAIRKKL